jgi:hypothetical protein
MNRLIIVGNGFDLAHGMKTGYNDFILWYLKRAFTAFKNSNRYIDDLIEITTDDAVLFSRELGNRSISDYVDSFYSNDNLNGLLKNSPAAVRSIMLGSSSRRRVRSPYEVKIKSILMSNLCNKCSSKNWVDIENLYYDCLKAVLQGKSNSKEVSIRELNTSLSCIILQLQKYLTQLEAPSNIDLYTDLISEDVQSSDIVIRLPGINNMKLSASMILNFNYTSTVDQYIFPNANISYIHGKLNDTNNPIIFGFGDELDDDYKQLELDKTKGMFDYIKSFWYFKTSNYHDLIRFIQGNYYQVYILGHSCGLSDRTMLNMVFEHKNCISIKIFYYEFPDGGNNYTELTQEISRHFKDKQSMRMKIVPFNKSSPMPQCDSLVAQSTQLNQEATE